MVAGNVAARQRLARSGVAGSSRLESAGRRLRRGMDGLAAVAPSRDRRGDRAGPEPRRAGTGTTAWISAAVRECRGPALRAGELRPGDVLRRAPAPRRKGGPPCHRRAVPRASSGRSGPDPLQWPGLGQGPGWPTSALPAVRTHRGHPRRAGCASVVPPTPIACRRSPRSFEDVSPGNRQMPIGRILRAGGCGFSCPGRASTG